MYIFNTMLSENQYENTFIAPPKSNASNMPDRPPIMPPTIPNSAMMAAISMAVLTQLNIMTSY